MTDRYLPHREHLVDAVLNSHGESNPAVRRAVEVRAAALGGRTDGHRGEIPAALTGYIDKVARHAYKTLDEDIQMLRRAGYSEDAIFEITVSAALGAGMARLERGLAALQGGR
jgi:alkylhydroperoxidase family enzyme